MVSKLFLKSILRDSRCDQPTALLVGVLFGYLILIPDRVFAEKVSWQGYEIHYTTFSSLLIPQEIAATHNIARAKNRIVTNVSILKDGEPQKATISGHNSNLLNQLYTMNFSEVTETTAIYYLANQLIDERDTIRFDLQIQPEGREDQFSLKFMRQY